MFSPIFRILLTFFAVSLAAPALVLAQTVPSAYRQIELGQGAGAFIGSMSFNPGRLELGPRSGTSFGGRYSLELSGPLFLEGLLTYLPTERSVIDPRRAEGDREIAKADVHLMMADVRLAFSVTGRRTWHGISPYLFAGGGLAHDLAAESVADTVLLDVDRFEFGTAFTGSGGLGIRWTLSSQIMVRFEGLLAAWQLNTPNGFDDPVKELDNLEAEEWVTGKGILFDIALRF